MLIQEPAADYFANAAVNKSALDAICRSPLHYQKRIIGHSAPIEPTPAMKLGTLVHTLVLEPDEVSDRYAITPAVDRRTKGGKEAYAAWEAQLGGRESITVETYDTAVLMSAAVLNHPVAAELLDGAVCERSAYGVDEATGIQIKARIDAIQRATLVDLKTTKDASAEGFAKSIANFRYHVQAAHYLETYKAATGDQPESFVFLAVESAPPYAVGVYQLDSASLAFAAQQRREDLEAIAKFHASSCPPSYNSNQLTTLSLPPWILRQSSQPSRQPLPLQQMETF